MLVAATRSRAHHRHCHCHRRRLYKLYSYLRWPPPQSLSESPRLLLKNGSAFNNFGCNGGLPSQAFEYIKYSGGLDTEQSYPYAGVNGVCSFKPENVGVKVLDSVNITQDAEHELKHAVGLVHPVSVAFEVIAGLKQYKEGVFTSDHCGSTPMDVNCASWLLVME